MTISFRMKVEDLFRIGERTVFAGVLETEAGNIANVRCRVEVDGKPGDELYIQGEVHTGKPHRDLWTTSEVALTTEIIKDRDVWLVSLQSS